VDIIFMGMGRRPLACLFCDVTVHLLYLLARKQKRSNRETPWNWFTRQITTVKIFHEKKISLRIEIHSFTPRLIGSK
jgi:hypothetical protein